MDFMDCTYVINIVLQVSGLDGRGNVVCLLCEGGTSVKFHSQKENKQHLTFVYCLRAYLVC